MKLIKNLCIFFVILHPFCLQADEPNALVTNISIGNNAAYFVLADGSCWKAVQFKTRWRSPFEWWQGVELVPKEYTSSPDIWRKGANITVHLKKDCDLVEDKNASNHQEISKCTHLLINHDTGDALFAIYFAFEDCLVQVKNDAYASGKLTGYETGWDEGYRAGKSKERQNFERQIHENERRAYLEGYEQAMRERAADLD